jgi:superoxide oxidase
MLLSAFRRGVSLVPMRSAMRSLSTGAQAIEVHYARPLQWVHWLTAAGTITIIGTAKASQWTTGPTFLGTKGKTKGTLMTVHKSTAVLMTALFVPRVLLKALTKAPAALEGSFLEQTAAKIGHASLYGFMAFMPATGIALGYYGGKGVPFYGLFTFPGKADKTKEDGQFAGKMFGWHKQVGQFYPAALSVHLGAVGYHIFKGQAILTRINPLAIVPK